MVKHQVDCLICKTSYECNKQRKRWDNCFICTEIHACNTCRKNCRSAIKGSCETDEELKNYTCPHQTAEYDGLWSTKFSRYATKQRRTFIRNAGSYPSCRICADEIRKEENLRVRKKKKREVLDEQKSETLVDKCCKVIAHDPGLVLVASTQYQVPEHVWEKIHGKIPFAISKDYKDELVESRDTNGEWMYKTIGEIFSRYRSGTLKRGRGF